MGFDIENFGVGLAAGWLSAYGVYRARHQIRQGLLTVRGGASSAQQSATRSADSRYVNDIIEKAETTHLGGTAIPLSKVLVEPRFLPPIPFAAPPDDEVIHDIFRVVPNVYDHPFLLAPYNVPTLSMSELGTGSKMLALLGQPGSGRTTALLTIAMYSLGHVEFKPPPDKIQERLDREEAALTEKDRAVRIKERITIEQRAKERLANERGVNFDSESDDALKNTIPLFKRLMPVYVHLADLLAPMSEFGKEVDPAEPLVRTVQANVKRVTASTIPRALYKRLNQGTVLVLIDGFDDLPEFERPRALAWLKAFRDQYSNNFIIVSGPVNGAGGLLSLGLTPVYMRPWNDVDIKTAVTSWHESWSLFRSKRSKRTKEKAAEGLDRALLNNRSLYPAEVIFKTWANFDDKVELAGYEGWIRAAFAKLIPKDDPLTLLLPRLAQIAAVQLDDGYITAARMQALSIAGIEGDTASENAQPSEENGKEAKTTEDTEKSSSQGRLLASLRRSGMLIRYSGDRYQFRHPLLAAYAASLWMKDASPDEQTSRSHQPAWAQTFAYLALHTPVDALVKRRLSAPPDILHSNLLAIARWMAYAGTDASWRGDVLRLLSTQLIAPNQYPLVRDRVAAALLDTRDRGALIIFRHAVRTMNADVRRLGCLCMGALGDMESIKDLKPLLNDQIPTVQLSAAMGLGAIANDAALEAMLVGFTEGSEQLRQAIAEAFAAIPEEGYPILYEAVSHDDMMLRRAAVFGLRRLKTTWSLIAIYRAFL
ncbi:MAG: HEAT repeat domain-containing protein, partial [Anaerolineae bacterium]|nr:HEAT repeat domain-containing protein [Anaerolineae bacterium]